MRKIIKFLVFALVLLAIGCMKEDHVSNNSMNKESFKVTEGKRLYNNYCSPCHGEDGDGFGIYLSYDLKPRPPDFTTPDFLKERSDDDLFLVINRGSKALGKSNLCPPWGNTLQRSELEYLVEYVKMINKNANDDRSDLDSK